MLETAIRAARAAGRLLLEGSRGEIEIDKRERRDVKLAMDRAAEKAIIEIVSEEFPDHAILSEERGRLGGESEHLWVIDPLDGTFNFAQRIPIWCTSIGLCRGEEEIVGVIYDPINDDLFAAEKGKGTFLNGKPMRVSGIDSLAFATICFSSSADEDDIEATMRAARHLAVAGGKVRGLGAAATHMAYLAAGRVDGFYDFGAKLWDVAAGLVILREAGGDATTRRRSGEVLDLVASNGRFHDDLLKAVEW